MPTEKGIPGQRGFPLRLFGAALTISLLAVAVGAGLSWRLQGRLHELRTRQFQLTEYVSRIMLFDEALTMSARMAAATGDFAYEKRYDKFDAELDALINETKSALERPEVRQFVEETDEANRKLVEMERRAFALASEARLTEATALLVGDEYLRLKGIYADGVEKTVAWQRSAIEGEQRTLQYLTIGFQISSGLVVLILLSSWYFALRTGRRWSQERLRSEASLRNARDELELRVSERTADLRIANETLRHGTEALEHEAQERKRVNDNLEMANCRFEKQNVRFDAALSNMSQALLMFDASGRLVVSNRRYNEMYRLSPDVLKLGCTIRELLKHRQENGTLSGDPDAYIEELTSTVAQGKIYERIVELPDGRTIAVVNNPMADGGWVATHEDITERRRADLKISYMARHDPLTDLPNRLLFHEQLEQALNRAKRGEHLAVLCLDVDHFKTVNDTLGHPIGDLLLRTAADRLRECIRETDIVARLGGDEFAVVQTGICEPTDATVLATRFIDAISAACELDGHQVVVGMSVGITIAPNDGMNPDQLLRNADMALYRAKADGRGTYRFFEPEMDARMQARRALELDLRKAIANGEFELFYQPLVNMQTRHVTGLEALIRWRHPQRGLLPPADFIPLAEETGLIVPLGEWVLRQACMEASTWPSDVNVAINVSPIQFKSRNLVPTVIAALAAAGLSPNRLELEITESVLLQESDATLALLHQLRSLGVRISMDDFGTGYSSLSYLRKFPFDKIKIDQSFIHEMSDRDDSLAIVRAVSAMGASLGIVTTAEGVETSEQLERLRVEGCTEVQGYFFSPPRPAAEVRGLLTSINPKLKAIA